MGCALIITKKLNDMVNENNSFNSYLYSSYLPCRAINMHIWPIIKKTIVCTGLLICLLVNHAACQENTVQPRGIYSSDFLIDGIPRTLTFYIPYNYGKYNNYPVVFVLHAEGETGKALVKKYGSALHTLADSTASIVVYPDAVKEHWNSKLGEHAATDTINDVGFISIMADYFVQQYHGDVNHIYAAGFYNGGDMAWRLGCNLTTKLTAVAPFTPLLQAHAKTCMPAVYFNTEKLMPPPGKKISNEALASAWKFLMNQTKK